MPGFDALDTVEGEDGTYIDLSEFGGPEKILLKGVPDLLNPRPDDVWPLPAGTDSIVERKQKVVFEQGDE